MSQALQFVKGATTGHSFFLASKEAAEACKGEKYYRASLCNGVQIIQLATIASELSSFIPGFYLWAGAEMTITGAAVVSYLACPLFAAIKQKRYEAGMALIKPVVKLQYPTIANYLPDTFSENTEIACGYLTDNLGSIVKICMFVGTSALGYLNPALAGGVFTSLVYQTIDARGWVPMGLNDAIETYMPMLASGGLLFGGGGIARGLGVLQVCSDSFTRNQFLQRKAEKSFEEHFKDKRLSPQQIEEDWVKIDADQLPIMAQDPDETWEVVYPT